MPPLPSFACPHEIPLLCSFINVYINIPVHLSSNLSDVSVSSFFFRSVCTSEADITLQKYLWNILILVPVDRERKLNVHKTFRRRHGHLLNVLCTFNLGPVSTRIWWRKAEKSSVYFENIIHIYTPVLYKTAVVEFTQKIVCVDAHTTLMILSESWHLKLVLHINSQHIVAGSKKSYLDS